MYLDKQLMFDENIAITVTRNSTNVIDLLRADQDIGTGENLWVFMAVPTAFTAGGAATLQVALVTDDNDTLTTPTILQDQPAVIAVASLIAGYLLLMRINPSSVFERYLGLVYTVATGPMLTGKVTAGITKDVQRWKTYASGYTVA